MSSQSFLTIMRRVVVLDLDTEKKDRKARRTRQKVGKWKILPSHVFIPSSQTTPATVTVKKYGRPNGTALRINRNYLHLTPTAGLKLNFGQTMLEEYLVRGISSGCWQLVPRCYCAWKAQELFL